MTVRIYKFARRLNIIVHQHGSAAQFTHLKGNTGTPEHGALSLPVALYLAKLATRSVPMILRTHLGLGPRRTKKDTGGNRQMSEAADVENASGTQGSARFALWYLESGFQHERGNC